MRGHDLVKIQDRPGLMKDRRTGAIINTDTNALDEYKTKKEMFRSMREAKSVVDDVNSLKKDIEEIKSLLTRILNK